MALDRRTLLSGLAAGITLPAFTPSSTACASLPMSTTLPEIDVFVEKMEEVLKRGLPA